MARTEHFNKWLAANRKASREVELENEHGWKAKHKVHSTKKAYKRRPKHRNRTFDDIY